MRVVDHDHKDYISRSQETCHLQIGTSKKMAASFQPISLYIRSSNGLTPDKGQAITCIMRSSVTYVCIRRLQLRVSLEK